MTQISVNYNGKLCVGWIQNGIHNRRCFRSEKDADKFQEMVNDIQNCIKTAEEMERFNRDFNYDPKIVELKNTQLAKEILELKKKVRIKNALQKKLGTAVQKLAEEPRNIIDKDTFFKEIRQLKIEINRLDRFFREHAIVALNISLQETLKEMKAYFNYQKEAIKRTEDMFKEIRKEIIGKFSSITTRDKLLSISEAAKYLGISYGGVRKLTYMQKLPFIKIGGRFRIREADLTNWLEDHSEPLN